MMTSKPEILKAVLSAALGLLTYIILDMVVALVLALLIGFLSSIPIVSNLLAWFFAVRGDGPSMTVIIVSAAISCFLSLGLVLKLCKSNSTCSLSCILMGIGLLLLQVYFLFSNLLLDGGGSVIANIASIIAGFVMIGVGKDGNT